MAFRRACQVWVSGMGSGGSFRQVCTVPVCPVVGRMGGMGSILFHPKVVHLPMALAVIMPLLLAGLLLAWRRSFLPARAWWIAVLMQGVMVASAVVSVRTGEAQEERVEDVVGEDHLEAHERAAKVFTIASVAELAAVGAVVPLLASPAGPLVASVAVLGSLGVLGVGIRAGAAGGELVYRHGAARAYMTGPAGGGEGSGEGAGAGEGAGEGDRDRAGEGAGEGGGAERSEKSGRGGAKD